MALVIVVAPVMLTCIYGGIVAAAGIDTRMYVCYNTHSTIAQAGGYTGHKEGTMRLEQFANKENNISYDDMSLAQRANLLNYIDAIADNIELDLDDPNFSVAEKVAACEDAAAAMLNEDVYTPEGEWVTIDDDTETMLANRITVALLKRYNLPLD